MPRLGGNPSRVMFIKMQLHSPFKILTFLLLLLLFNRIDASSDVDIEELIRNENGNDNWPEEPENAIDDFELDSSPCGKDMFQCLTSRECIDKYQYCDYIVDCADGTDEIKCGTCDYRNASYKDCGWKDASTIKSGWSVKDGALRTPPITVSKMTSFNLQSPNLQKVGYFCQLILRANLKATTIDSKLYVFHKLPNAEQPIHVFTITAMNKTAPFTELVVPIKPPADSSSQMNHGAYSIAIGALLYKVGDQVAIQSIRFENCNPKRTVGSCDFERGDFCLWKPDPRSQLPWNIARAGSVNQTYAPTADHTGSNSSGHYIWTQYGKTGNPNASPVAVLTSERISYQSCFSLWYYMDGATFLQLSITDRELGSSTSRNDGIVSSPTSGVWKFKQVNIPYRWVDYAISIEAQVEDPGGLIAVDDIQLKFGACTFETCTFEEGNCGYRTSSGNGNSSWTLITAQKMQDLTSMTFADHSTGTLNGHMMLFIPHVEGDISWLTSPESDFSGYRCLQFWYYISDYDVGTLEVYHHNGFSIPDLDVDKKNGYIFRGQSTLLLGGGWRKITITLPPVPESVIDFIATAGSDVNYGFISLDDISIRNGRCADVVSTDFEYDNGGWHIDSDLSMAPMERQAPARRRHDYCVGPPTDHTLQTVYGHYLYFCYHTNQQLTATIKSDDFDGHSNWCFSFWTYFTSLTNIRVDVYLNNIDGNSQLASIQGDNVSEWKYHQLNIAGDSDYEIDYLSVTVTPFDFILNQGVAIDDIKLVPFKCDYHPKTDDPNHPGHPTPPPEAELFDWECNFELNSCNYFLNSSHGSSFQLTKANFPTNQRANTPTTDHTYHALDGGYLELSRGSQFSPNSKKYAMLQAKSVISASMFPNATVQQVCVDFWYVLNGEAVNWLNISVMSSDNDTLQTVEHIEGTFGPTWRHKSVTVTFFDDFYLYFTGGSSDSYHGVVALDDIAVNVGPCPFEGLCDFSSTACGWDNNISLPLRFEMSSAFLLLLNYIETADSPMPISDHTSKTIYGGYMYLNASFDTVGEAAQLISPITRPNMKCLQFWYYLYGVNVGSLNVYVIYNGLVNLKYLLKSEINSDVNGWMFSQIPLERHFYDMDFQFVIEVKRGGAWGDALHVAIDDIEIREFCQPIGSCDFENDFCQYSNEADLALHRGLNMSTWDRATGRYLANGPPGDHTTGKYGVFAYIDKGPLATLYTPYFTLTSPACLTFFYYLATKTQGGVRSVFPHLSVEVSHLSGGNSSHQAIPIVTLDGSSMAIDRKERGWSKHQIIISPSSSKLSFQFTGFISQANQLIAIDDIKLKPGKCEAIPKNNKGFPCIANPKVKTDYVPLTKRCDFVKDCPSGADEANCGYDCTFAADDNCDWTVVNVTSTFLKVDLSAPTKSPFKKIVPIRDYRSANDYKGTYLRLWDAPGAFIDNPEANYESPWMQNTGPQCSFLFYVFLTDPVDRQALVRVNLIRPDNPLGIEIFRDEATQRDEMQFWASPTIDIGRVHGKFKIQINARMKISRGGGAIAIDDIHFYQSLCMIETKAKPVAFSCNNRYNSYHCANGNYCFGEDKLCDYTDQCGDGSDESPKYCDSPTRAPLRCDFETGTCLWRINSHVNKTALNGFHWGAIDDVDEYAYGLKRDHTLNSEFGHVVYLWNQERRTGQIESPLIKATYCTFRIHYVYKSKQVTSGMKTTRETGFLNVYIKFSQNGRLFKYGSVSSIGSHHFERKEVKIDSVKVPFYVVLEVVPGTDHYGIWGIDDISFDTGCKPAGTGAVTVPNYTPYPVTTAAPNQCNGTDFACDQYMCIQRSQVCDFYFDCDDSTDESNCGETTFKTGWTDLSEGRLSWNIGNDGVVRSNVHDGIGSSAFLQSVAYGQSGAACTVAFNYFVNQSTTEALELNLITTAKRRAVQNRVFSSTKATGIKYGKWNSAKIFLGEHDMGWQLQFIGRKDVVNNANNSLQLKNIQFLNCLAAQYNYTNCEKKGMFTCANGVCILPSQLCDFQDNCGDESDEKNCQHLSSYRCNFEGGKKRSPTCDLDLTDNKWKRFTGYETKNFIGPGLDHTIDSESGHFMMLTSGAFAQVSVNSDSAFISPLFDPDNSGNCHLRFWYMMNGVGTLQIQERISTTIKLISSIDTSPTDTFVWKRFSTPLVSKLPFQIAFDGDVGSTITQTFIALDDISFTGACKLHSAPHHHGGNGTTPAPGSKCLENDQFECIDGSCIGYDQVCDFFKNCPGGDDEIDCPVRCDFDHNVTDDSMCFWGTNDDDAIPEHVTVTAESAKTAAGKARFYPKTDATLNTTDGKYLLFYGVNKTESVDKKISLNVYSPEYVSASPLCTLNFDYYVATDDVNGGSSEYMISLVEITTDRPIEYDLMPIFAEDPSSNSWIHVSIGLGHRANTFQIVLTREANPNMTDSLAIDNIQFTNCAYTAPHDTKPVKPCPAGQFTCGTHHNCIPAVQECDLKCDCPYCNDEHNCTATFSQELTFEASDGFKSSGWTLGAKGHEGEEPWVVAAGPAPQRASTQTGPPFDHTYFNKTGHYLYSASFDFGVDAWFISPMLKPTSKAAECHLLFYYYMYGPGDNQVCFYVKNVTSDNVVDLNIPLKTGSKDYWRQAIVKLESPGSSWQVVISGISGGDYAVLAIDDLILSPGCVIDTSKPTLPPPNHPQTTASPTTQAMTTNTPEPTPNPGSYCQGGTYWCPADKVCLPDITNCNFVKDCSDGSDELAPSCTQESCPITAGSVSDDCGMDIFFAEGALAYSWLFSTAANFTAQTGVQFTGLFPTFIYMDLSAGIRDDYSNLVTKTISETGVACMLKFQYACDPSNCPLQVSIVSHRSTGNVKSLLWVPMDAEFVSQSAGYHAYTAEMYIGRRNTFQVSIGSLKQQTSKAYVLLSNVQFVSCEPAKYVPDPSSITCDPTQFKCAKSYGNCLPQAAVCDFQNDCRLKEDESACDSYVGRCDMENLDKCDFWEFEQYDMRWSWTEESGQHGLAYLPSIDHTAHSEANYYLSFHSNLISNYLGNHSLGQIYTTSFVSNWIAANVTSDCHLRFWYNIIGPSHRCQLRVMKQYSPLSFAKVNKIPLESRIEDFWLKYDSGSLSESTDGSRTPQKFQLVIEGVVQLVNTQPCSVNLDDVSLTPACTALDTPDFPPDVPNPNNTWNLCRPNFQCDNKRQCYSFQERCNFIFDCDDNTDEESCPSVCTFDEPTGKTGNTATFCGWYSPKGLLSKFTKQIGPSPSSKLPGGTGPTGDYPSGKGAYIVASNFSSYNAKTQFHSPYYASSGLNCRFSFSYFLNEPKHLDKLRLYLKSNTHPAKVSLLWSYKSLHAYGQAWNNEKVNIGKQKGFSLLFEATQGVKNSKADLALDNFQFTNCHQNETQMELACEENEYRCADKTQCIEYWRFCDAEFDCADGSDEGHCIQTNGTCWFVDDNWKTHCHWIDLKRDFTFVYEAVAINATKDHETNTGPQSLLNDKYGYALMKAKGRKFGERAAIASPEFPASTGICSMGFHYYMYGADTMGQLLVYTLGKNGKRIDFFRLSGNQGPGWNYEDNIVVGNPSPFRVVFEGIVGSSQYSDIAVGYVSFSKDCIAGRWTEKGNVNVTIGGTCQGFYCHTSHECIDRDWVCDKVVDCSDGTDEENCNRFHDRRGGSSMKTLIIGFSVLAVVVILAVPGAIFTYRRYVNRQTGDRVPFFDNSFETTSHRDLDFTSSRSTISSRSNRKIVTFEMTKRNTKSD